MSTASSPRWDSDCSCQQPTGERTQRLFSFLREELEKRGTKLPPEDEDGSGILDSLSDDNSPESVDSPIGLQTPRPASDGGSIGNGTPRLDGGVSMATTVSV